MKKRSKNTQTSLNIYNIIAKKRDGKSLSNQEIEFVIDGCVSESIPDYQLSALLMAIYINGMNSRELSDLTAGMLRSGDLINLESIESKKIDKHSTGGVGDKISFILSPLVAACGVKVPMVSGRALGHTGGTLDKLESIPGMKVSLNADDFKTTLASVGMVIAGQTQNIAPADRKFYALRDATATIGSIPLISASIMSKKLALGTDGIVLDVKTGSGAFMSEPQRATELCKTLVSIGEQHHRTTIGLITNMDQPLGRAVGNSLEIIESIETLKGNGPEDVLTVTFGLGAAMLIAAGKETSYKKAIHRLEATLSSGTPLEIFKKFISAQGGNAAVCDNYTLFPQPEHQLDLLADSEGYISRIDTLAVGMAAIDIGVGRKKMGDKIQHGAGFLFNKKTGDRIRIGEKVLTIYANDGKTMKNTQQRLKDAITISKGMPKPSKPIHLIIDKSGIRSWQDCLRH